MLSKFCKLGDKVECVSGRYKGKIGHIIKLEPTTCFINLINKYDSIINVYYHRLILLKKDCKKSGHHLTNIFK